MKDLFCSSEIKLNHDQQIRDQSIIFSIFILINPMKKIGYAFPMQISINESIHYKIQKAVAGIKINKYSETASEEELKKRKPEDIYLNDIYQTIKQLSHLYIIYVNMYQDFIKLLREVNLVTTIPSSLELSQKMNRELRYNLALIKGMQENKKIQVCQQKTIGKEQSQLHLQFQQLKKRYENTLKELSELKAKDEVKNIKNPAKNGTKTLLACKNPIQEMYHNMADFQNWTKTNIQQKKDSLDKVSNDKERKEIEEMASQISNYKKEIMTLQSKCGQTKSKSLEELQEIKLVLLKQKEDRHKMELEVKRLQVQIQELQQKNQQLRHSITLERQQSEMLRANDRKNRQNYSKLSNLQSKAEEKNKELYSLLAKAREQQEKLASNIRTLQRENQLILERCRGFETLLKQILI